ncbi:MAG: GNAT family N-acetyltransferase [Lactobacillales bacterium]|jgi:ribosomal protein S18 acetylase RimI-like enzyme|nr:GNAT family N-acetyltransferase [Lactobacillales bacterium]
MFNYIQIFDSTLYPEILKLYQSNKDYFKLNDTEVTFQTVDEDVHAKPDSVLNENKKYFLVTDEFDKPKAVLDYLVDYPTTNVVYIGLFLVDKALQRKHIGRQIIREQLEKFRAMKKKAVRLGVLVENKSAIAFWESLGFVIIEENKQNTNGNLVHELELAL